MLERSFEINLMVFEDSLRGWLQKQPESFLFVFGCLGRIRERIFSCSRSRWFCGVSKALSPQIDLAGGEPSKSLVSMFASCQLAGATATDVIISLSLSIRMYALYP